MEEADKGCHEAQDQHAPRCVIQRRDGLECGLCAARIAKGDRVFPVLVADAAGASAPQPSGKACPHCWVHWDCRGRLPRDWAGPPACRHWLRTGTCAHHAEALCVFSHPPREAVGEAAPAPCGQRDAPRTWGGRRRKLRNKCSGSVFRVWLLRTYGLPWMERTTVLDVAGGQGSLGFELHNLNRVRTLVIDPRPSASYTSLVSRWRKGLFSSERLGPVFSRWGVSDDKAVAQTPHFRAFFDGTRAAELACFPPSSGKPLAGREVAPVEGEGANSDTTTGENVAAVATDNSPASGDTVTWWDANFQRSSQVVWSTKGLGIGDGREAKRAASVVGEEELAASVIGEEEPAASIVGVDDAARWFRDCGLVVGMHPDQVGPPGRMGLGRHCSGRVALAAGGIHPGLLCPNVRLTGRRGDCGVCHSAEHPFCSCEPRGAVCLWRVDTSSLLSG